MVFYCVAHPLPISHPVIMTSPTNPAQQAKMKLYGKDLAEYDDIDIDELLEKLTPEELEELGQELIDPDVSAIKLSRV